MHYTIAMVFSYVRSCLKCHTVDITSCKVATYIYDNALSNSQIQWLGHCCCVPLTDDGSYVAVTMPHREQDRMIEC